MAKLLPSYTPPTMGEYQLSFSSAQQVNHGCKRLYQLRKMLNYPAVTTYEDTIHTLFGKGVGAAVPILLADPTAIDLARHTCFMEWEESALWQHINSKSISTALMAVEEFAEEAARLLEQGWAIAEVNGRPATEVSFKLTVQPYGYYIGYVDVIMYHAGDDAYGVVEVKTQQGDYDSNQWLNRMQDVGYLFVGALTGNYTGRTLYPTYVCTADRQYWNMPSYDRDEESFKDFLKWLELTFRTIQWCDEAGNFPRSGNCFQYGRQCGAFSACREHIEALPPADTSIRGETEWDIDVVIDLRPDADADADTGEHEHEQTKDF